MDSELVKGTLSLLVLSLLARRGMYGYELAATVHRETGGAFVWKEGSLYPCLHKLEADGLITGAWEESEGAAGTGGGGRKRKVYHLTKAGKGALAEKVGDWTELVKAVGVILESGRGQA